TLPVIWDMQMELHIQSQTDGHQRTAKRHRISDNPDRLNVVLDHHSLADIVDVGVVDKNDVFCKNSACKRRSCRICYRYDYNRDPSLWLVCSSCGTSCHLECLLEREKSGLPNNGKSKGPDGSFLCVSCGELNDLLGVRDLATALGQEVEETLGTPVEVRSLEETPLEDLGLNTFNHDTPLSSKEIPSFDKPEPQPQPCPSFSSLEVDLGEERGPEQPFKPPIPDSFRMKEVNHLTSHTPASPHVASFHPKDRLYLTRRGLEVLRKFHWTTLGGRYNQLSHVSSLLLSKPGEY
nr:hypothetical protein [Tanacetum cinerariifolium]